MAHVLVRLKLRLLVNGLRASSVRLQFFVLSAIAAVTLGAFGFFAFRAGAPGFPRIIFPIFVLVWAVFPVMAFGLDETLDPARLAPFPIRRRRLIPGLLLASAVGPWPLAFLLALSGAVPGYARSRAGSLVALAAVLVMFAFCLALSRAVATSMARLLRSRRGKDLAIVLSTGLALLFAVAGQLLRLSPGGVTAFASAFRWTPPGLAARALVAVRQERLVDALWSVAAVAACTGLVLAWWALALSSARIPSDTSTGARRRVRFGGRAPLGAVVAKELRYTLRDPLRRAQLPSLLVPAVMVATSAGRTGGAYAAVGVAVLSGLALASNQVGEDGSAYWLHVHLGHSALLGKTIVRGGMSALVTTLAAVGVTAATGKWADLPPALLTAYGGLLLALGFAAVISVRVPFPPPPSGNPFTSDPGRGCASGAYVLGAMVGCALLLAPSVALVLADLPYPGAALAVAVGAAGWAVGMRTAEGFARRAHPEILAAIIRRT